MTRDESQRLVVEIQRSQNELDNFKPKAARSHLSTAPAPIDDAIP
jgi:hypothetical protein